MSDHNWPTTKSKTFARLVGQSIKFYDKELTHEDFIELNEKIRNRNEGVNYHQVQNFFTQESRNFYAVWQADRWVACKRNQTHVCDLLHPGVLDEFRENKLHYREPHVLPFLRACKANCIELFQWDGFCLAEWIEFSERIRNAHRMPGVLKIEDRGDKELWVVNKKGLYWFACVWDPSVKAVVEIEKADSLYTRGLLTDPDS